jgi:hypothetical protein
MTTAHHMWPSNATTADRSHADIDCGKMQTGMATVSRQRARFDVTIAGDRRANG